MYEWETKYKHGDNDVIHNMNNLKFIEYLFVFCFR